MAKKSIVTNAKNTMVDATKSGAEGVKSVASEALVAGATAATGVVLQRVSTALGEGAKKVDAAQPSATKVVTKAVAFSGSRKAPAKIKKEEAVLLRGGLLLANGSSPKTSVLKRAAAYRKDMRERADEAGNRASFTVSRTVSTRGLKFTMSVSVFCIRAGLEEDDEIVG